ncbi:MAG: proline--tRNA ligase [Bacillaceae bacterium]|nr:proline--tRNA ligase [Bacillaceae bacterium]
MKQSRMFIPTLREVPAEAEIASHQLLLRAGFIRQLVSGVYTYLPLGYRVLRKIEQIVREEMNRAGAQELLMPAIQPAELWKETGRWDAYGPELMRLKDRHDRDFVLGPTHEEVITSLVRDHINTYKKLPLNLYQIQTKYRDEVRPRFGVLRSREFIMKDAYSFDVDREGLDKSFQAMYEAYQHIFTRCGVDFRAVEADAGAIGGSDTYEFMVLSDVGEDTIAYCRECSYSANLEKAEVRVKETGTQEGVEDPLPLEKVHTPDARTVEQIRDFFNISEQQIIKSLMYKVDEQYVLALVRGDHELNDLKLKNLFGGNVIEMATDRDVQTLMGTPTGFMGPVDVNRDKIKVVADHAVKYMVNAVTGANEQDYHYQNVNVERDFTVDQYADIRNITEKDQCPKCGGEIAFARGIEVGHVFKLGTKYSEAMGAKFLDENGKEQVMIMGCYGIGISRTMQAVAEQRHDEDGIQWPWTVAPFHIHLIPVNVKKDIQRETAEQLYQKLQDEGYEVLFDDRAERAGVKFKDSDLIGIPIRITIGGKIEEGLVEVKLRHNGEVYEIPVEELLTRLNKIVADLI